MFKLAKKDEKIIPKVGSLGRRPIKAWHMGKYLRLGKIFFGPTYQIVKSLEDQRTIFEHGINELEFADINKVRIILKKVYFTKKKKKFVLPIMLPRNEIKLWPMILRVKTFPQSFSET